MMQRKLTPLAVAGEEGNDCLSETCLLVTQVNFYFRHIKLRISGHLKMCGCVCHLAMFVFAVQMMPILHAVSKSSL